MALERAGATLNRVLGVFYPMLSANTHEEMMKYKEQLKGIEWVYAVYTTPSGKGLKAIVQHDNIFPEYHTELYNELLSRFDIPEIDPHTKDLARGNYMSYDPDLWKNPNPVGKNGACCYRG